MQEHLPILKRVGFVLLVAGLLDIVAMVYSILHKGSYSSNLNIFAVIAGIFLMCGNVRSAGVITWITIGMLVSCLMEAVCQFFQPFDLLRLKLAFYLPQVFVNVVLWALPTILFLWVVKELLRTPVLQARAEKKKGRLIPPVVPVIISIILLASVYLFLALNVDDRAKGQIQAAVERNIGPGYKYYTRPFRVMYSSKSRFYDVEVTAYNDEKILVFPVRWKAE